MLNKTLARTLTLGAVVTLGLGLGTAAPAHAETEVDAPSSFTSAFTVMATPDQVINADGEVAPGEEGASGTYTFRINSDLEIICYDITLTGVSGEYESPAKTATHIHEAAKGKAGPPRISFPNPSPVGDGPRTSSGCLEGPFTTGVEAEGSDTGEGFSLAEIEADPTGFVGDAHTADFPAGVVRGQLSQVPVGGVEAGSGGAAAAVGTTATTGTTAVTVGVAALLASLGVLIGRRRAGVR